VIGHLETSVKVNNEEREKSLKLVELLPKILLSELCCRLL